MELNRDDRGKLAEITIEYPPGRRNQGRTIQEEGQRGRKRKYICLNCARTCRTPIGKGNQVKRNPERRQVRRQETCEDICQSWNMSFRAPAELRLHLQYVCADLKQTEPTQNAPGETTEEESRQRRRGNGSRRIRRSGNGSTRNLQRNNSIAIRRRRRRAAMEPPPHMRQAETTARTTGKHQRNNTL